MLVLAIHFLSFLGLVFTEFPDFGDDYDYEDYTVCEEDACTNNLVYLLVEKTVAVPNRSVTYREYEYFDVNTEGLLADCGPALSVGDIATYMKTCKEVERKYRQACNYRKKGWLGEDGVTIKETLDKDFVAIVKMAAKIQIFPHRAMKSFHESLTAICSPSFRLCR